jgi:hypothetical protein
MRLRLAARDLLDAAELVVARWERGDLGEAVRELSAAIGARHVARIERLALRSGAPRRGRPA